MMNGSAHFAKAQDTAQFHADLVALTADHRNHHCGWVIVGMFYEAVHLIEGYRHGQYQQESANHRERANYVSTYCEEIAADYEALMDRAFRARYRDHAYNDQDVVKSRRALEAIRSHFSTLDLVYRQATTRHPVLPLCR